MNLSPTLLVSIAFWKTIANPSYYFMIPSTAAAFSAATTTTTIVRVKGSGVESVNKEYEWTPATIIPPGFEKVCVQNRWTVKSTWEHLNHGRPWLRASNDAYIYLNSADGQWWIDKPDGNGVYVAPKDQAGGSCDAGEDLPPATGWKALSSSYNPVPLVELIADGKK